MKRLRGTLTVVLGVVLASTACGDDPGPTDVGTVRTLLVSLETPFTDDGTALVVLRGPGMISAERASQRYELFWRIASTDEMRAIVTGGLAAGPLFSVEVPEGVRAESYTATIVEVAAGDDRVREALDGYRLLVEGAGR